MPLTTKYSAVSTKIRAMASHLLTQADYTELSRKNSVSEVALYLKNQTGYAGVLKAVNELQIHRGELEKLIHSVLFGEMRRLEYFLDDSARKYLKVLSVQYEVEFLKSRIRQLFHSEEIEPVLQDAEYFKELFPKLDVDGICMAKTYSQLLERLRGTMYEKTLAHYDHPGASLFQIETALDVLYIETVTKQKEKLLKGRDLAFARDSIGRETDLSNILAVIRAGTYYDAGEQIVYSMIVPRFYKMRREELLNLIRAKSPAGRRAVLDASYYQEVFSYETHGFYDHNIKEYMYRFYRAGIKDTSSIGVVLSYIRLKEIEIENIIAVIEGIRYQLSPEQTRSYLIGYEGGKNGQERR